MLTTTLCRNYTFETYISGENNIFAVNVAKAIAENPGIDYNPCLISGAAGTGKTHLLQAIGNYILQLSDKSVVYTSAEEFANVFYNAVKTDGAIKLKNKYLQTDVLLIDDIQHLQGQEVPQQELYAIFDDLYNANKQMVFTCDLPVGELKKLKNQLISRFERSITADIEKMTEKLLICHPVTD